VLHNANKTYESSLKQYIFLLCIQRACQLRRRDSILQEENEKSKEYSKLKKNAFA
jgi:hypothetical protein